MDLSALKPILSETDFNKVAFDANQKSHALNHAAALYRNDHPIKELENKQFKLADTTHFFVEGEEGKIQISEGSGIRFMDLPDLAAAILDQLNHENPKAKDEVFSTIFEEYEIEAEEKEQVAVALENQLIELINAAIVAIA